MLKSWPLKCLGHYYGNLKHNLQPPWSMTIGMWLRVVIEQSKLFSFLFQGFGEQVIRYIEIKKILLVFIANAYNARIFWFRSGNGSTITICSFREIASLDFVVKMKSGLTRLSQKFIVNTGEEWLTISRIGNKYTSLIAWSWKQHKNVGIISHT